MLRAAVYDDNIGSLDELCGIIRDYGEHSGGFEINRFVEPTGLSSSVREGEEYSLLVLGADNRTLARELRELTPQSYMILLRAQDTPHGDCRTAVLPTPVVKDELKAAVNTAVNLSCESDGKLTIFTPRGEKNVMLSSIMYVEVLGHTLRFYLADGQRIDSKVLRITFERAARPLFCDRRFLRPHRSYLVNAAYVERVKRAELRLKNGADIPVSRLRLRDVKHELSLFNKV